MICEKYKRFETAPPPLPLPLREQEEILSTWESGDKPLVSICCATFNHSSYLDDAIRGFLGQITSFPIEILIRDDASTDGTTEIILDYVTRYPKIIRAIVETENQHSKGIRANLALLPHAKGEFIALCEGDDYWITNDKLAIQVAMMKGNNAATMCVARTVVCKYIQHELKCTELILGNDNIIQEFADINECYFHTSTYLMRTCIYRDVINKYGDKIEFGDTTLRYLMVDVGPILLLKQVVSVYRYTGKGIWSSLSTINMLDWEIKVIEGFYDNFPFQYREFFGIKLFKLYLRKFLLGNFEFKTNNKYFKFKKFIFIFIKYGLILTATIFSNLMKELTKKYLNVNCKSNKLCK